MTSNSPMSNLPKDSAESLIEKLRTLSKTDLILHKKEIGEANKISASDVVNLWQSLRREGEVTEAEKSQSLLERFLELDIEPWETPVSLAELIRIAEKFLTRTIIFKNRQYAPLTCALWVVATWFVDSISFASYLLITAPTKQSGKSQLLKCISKLVARPLSSGSISASSMFRLIDKYHPTLLLDEVDMYLKRNEELQGILNCGIERGNALVLRTERDGDNQHVTAFDAFGFKALSGIGARNLSETVTDRSIVIELQRKAQGEKVEKIREIDADEWLRFKRQCKRASLDYALAISNARPILPDGLSDREGDKWETLIAIADASGDETLRWQARECATHLATSENDTSPAKELLANIEEIFRQPRFETETTILSADLLHELTGNEEWAWCHYNNGVQALTLRQLALKLKEFGIQPQNIRREHNCRGYSVAAFRDLFDRYLPKREKKVEVDSPPTEVSQEGKPIEEMKEPFSAVRNLFRWE